MPVITVSGSLGSNAREVARELAEALKIQYVDSTLLVDAAQRLHVPLERVAEHDERTKSFGERLSGALRSFLERSATMGATDPMLGTSGLEMVLARSYEEEPETTEADISDRQYVEVLSTIMEELASRGNVVIVGRGSHMILKDYPDALHVNLVAPRPWRTDFIVQRDALDPQQAARRLERHDRGRISYHRKLFGVHPDDPHQFHITFNAARIGQDRIVKTVLRTVEASATAAPVS